MVKLFLLLLLLVFVLLFRFRLLWGHRLSLAFLSHVGGHSCWRLGFRNATTSLSKHALNLSIHIVKGLILTFGVMLLLLRKPLGFFPGTLLLSVFLTLLLLLFAPLRCFGLFFFLLSKHLFMALSFFALALLFKLLSQLLFNNAHDQLAAALSVLFFLRLSAVPLVVGEALVLIVGNVEVEVLLDLRLVEIEVNANRGDFVVLKIHSFMRV
jgi:hypothetical protein